MVSKQEQLVKADRAIKDAEIRLRTIKASLYAVEREIDVLSTVESQLEENLNYLKRKNIIALAVEYKKAKADLKAARTRLSLIRGDKEKLRKEFVEGESILENCKKAYDLIVKGPENNVILGKFRKK